MIVDLVRNDLGRLAEVGSVVVEQLMAVESYPGLYHLVSSVAADIGRHGWPDIFAATFPPGSVSGAPKSSAGGHRARGTLLAPVVLQRVRVDRRGYSEG